MCVLALAASACGQLQGSALPADICVRGPTRTPPPTLKAGALRTPSTPDLRPDSTRMAEIDAGRKWRLDWMNRYISSGCDPRTLPQVAIGQADGPSYATFGDAVARADTIVIGHVAATIFQTDVNDVSAPLSDATIVVERSLKGPASGEIALHQYGGPAPDDGGQINHFEGDPVFLPGDHVLLLAVSDYLPQSGKYVPLYPVGKYYIRRGAVYAADGNPCEGINGRSMDEVSETITAYISAPPPQGSTSNPCDGSHD